MYDRNERSNRQRQSLATAALSATAGVLCFWIGLDRWDDPSGMQRFAGFFLWITGIEALAGCGWYLLKVWRNIEPRPQGPIRMVILYTANLLLLALIAFALAHCTNS